MKKLKKTKVEKQHTVYSCNCAAYCMRSCGSSCGSSPRDYQTQDNLVFKNTYVSQSYVH